MSADRIQELELLLAAANENIARLTRENAALTAQVASAMLQAKRNRRNSRQGEDELRAQLSAAQNRR